MASVQPIGVLSFRNFATFQEHCDSPDSLFRRTLATDLDYILHASEDYTFPGYCGVCCAPTSFAVSFALSFVEDSQRIPLWRETILCPRCAMNNRMRAMVHLMSAELRLPPAARIYTTEQVTPTFTALSKAWPNTIGSEFLRDATPGGEINAAGLRHEDLTNLTFDSNAFDAVVTMDVIEHVPNYAAALRECCRVLKPSGILILSAPFNLSAANSLIRARVRDDGTIEHIAPPEYHGDPLDANGLLCFTTFGWDFLDTLAVAGFEQPRIAFYWSDRFGYLGVQYCVIASKPERSQPGRARGSLLRLPRFLHRRRGDPVGSL